jgi:uncharacterized protein
MTDRAADPTSVSPTSDAPATELGAQPRRAPTRPGERVMVLDALRGFAILGILLVNAPLFFQPLWSEVLAGSAAGALDRVAAVATEALAEGKFFTLFSLLFGVGAAMQMRRAAQRGRRFAPFFVRRIAVLAAIGAAHAFLIWWGDILLYYAVLGLALVPLTRAPARRALRWAVVVAAVPLVLNLGLFGLTTLATLDPEAQQALAANTATQVAGAERSAAAAVEAYRGTDIGAMIAVRVSEWSFATTGLLLNGMMFLILAMFLVGLAVGKLGLLDDVERHARTLRRARLTGFLVGVPATLAWLLVRPPDPFTIDASALIGTVAFVLGAPALSIGYAATLTLATRDPAWRRRLTPLAALGRVALSAYLMQSLVMTTLALGYGAGLYGRIGPAGALAMAIALLAIQVPLAGWWTRRFRFGPAEWLWRSLSYGRLQPMRPAAETA